MGKDEGFGCWPLLPCFACNDLAAHMARYRCKRTDWNGNSKSVLSFPIRHATNSLGTEFETYGFLQFDSPRAKAFRGMPNAFNYRDNVAKYVDLLHAKTGFYIGAIIADTIGMAIGLATDK